MATVTPDYVDHNADTERLICALPVVNMDDSKGVMAKIAAEHASQQNSNLNLPPTSNHARPRQPFNRRNRMTRMVGSGSESESGSGIEEDLLQWNRNRDTISDRLQGISPIISETDDSITIRRPLQYNRLNHSVDAEMDNDTQAALQRYRYYSRLDPTRDSTMLMPNHIVPSFFYQFIPIKLEGDKQSSLITIFSIWNTMMGTSLLSMPWALNQAGFTFGLLLMLIMAVIAFYTAYRVMNSVTKFGIEASNWEFSDICHHYFGPSGSRVAICFSMLALLGASIVYWVLMTNFLYNVVTFVHDHFDNNSTEMHLNSSSGNCSLIIPPSATLILSGRFQLWWSQTRTVPFFLILLLFPLVNFKSPTFFTKFNALGTLSVLFMLCFVIVKGSESGINMNWQLQNIHHFKWTFPALTGTLSLALFIHNCVISILRMQKHPENNARDLSLAYLCVALTYILIAGIFYVTFPGNKDCILDNLLNNFPNSDVLSFVARICLLFQMLTVFPLLLYILRVQFWHAVMPEHCPRFTHIISLNVVVIAICLLFAVFLPSIGTIIRFAGALCGLVYIFTLPGLVYMKSRQDDSSLGWPCIALHVLIIFLGVANFVGQFIAF